MSNARSPREVCSTTIGTSGLTVRASFRVWRPNPSRPATAARSSWRESSARVRPPERGLDGWSGAVQKPFRGSRYGLRDVAYERDVDVAAAVARAVVAVVQAGEDAAHRNSCAAERRVVGRRAEV